MLSSVFASAQSLRTEPTSVLRLCRHLALGFLTLPLMAAPGVASPATVGAQETLALAASPLPDGELADMRNGFSIGGFDLAVGIVSRSVLGQSDGTGGRLEVVSRYSVPAVGRLAHDGTTVQTLPGHGSGPGDGPLAGTLPASGIVISTLATGATVDLGGTTRLTHRLLDAFVVNSDVNRAITRQLDINLEVGGLARSQRGASGAGAASSGRCADPVRPPLIPAPRSRPRPVPFADGFRRPRPSPPDRPPEPQWRPPRPGARTAACRQSGPRP